jgi:hypothetical protein
MKARSAHFVTLSSQPEVGSANDERSKGSTCVLILATPAIPPAHFANPAVDRQKVISLRQRSVRVQIGSDLKTVNPFVAGAAVSIKIRYRDCFTGSIERRAIIAATRI